ncbi:SgcJ/EcaC family oxidoreductase [Leptospira sp. 201903070]|uniref:SgcJ/EcaC family oxidoreductase n=1 Tax=Leptospira ainlahdjerensis TaxID=2810033 RepID=A0ABS2U965_9LEPT|nr:SgcJ/EcaC family oxidoreductase [Leptospira ainlahdjerensis]MBM9575777.1 SgcJ/EcaC family oxidoreductase [Leptospira ainlahdjerensis]
MEIKEITTNIIKTLESAWNRANGEEFGKAFTKNSDFVDIRGDLHYSDVAVAKGHQAIFDTIYKDSKIKLELLQANQIDLNTILVHAKASLDCPSGPLVGKTDSTISMILTNSDESWSIRAFHNTLKPLVR